MPKKLLESQKKEIVDDFFNGLSIQELSNKFNCTKVTITRHLKKGVEEETFKNLLKKNNTNNVNHNKPNLERNITSKNYSDITYFEEEKSLEFFEASSFTEIAPLDLDIDNAPQKDLSSISITEIEFPKIVYLIVDNKIELQTKLLKDYPDWQFLSQDELNRSTIQIFFDIKIAKRFCNKEQKVLKVPNPNVFKIVAPILVSNGISRIVSPDKLIAL